MKALRKIIAIEGGFTLGNLLLSNRFDKSEEFED